jgi:hypothetical protein
MLYGGSCWVECGEGVSVREEKRSDAATSMYLIYIDESYDKTHFVYSAIFIDAFAWNTYFDHVLKWRKEWFEKYQIPLDFELHATDFVGDRGEFPLNRNKLFRSTLFHEAIGRIELIDNIKIINAITQEKKKHIRLFEYMLNRINRTLETLNAYGVLICDEGNENTLTSMVRKMKKENHIPSQVDLDKVRNIPLERIIEDPLFKTSKSSYFIQLADFLAFSLLRNEKPLENSTLDFVRSAFEQLDNSLVKVAFKNDHRKKGIIRV